MAPPLKSKIAVVDTLRTTPGRRKPARIRGVLFRTVASISNPYLCGRGDSHSKTPSAALFEMKSSLFLAAVFFVGLGLSGCSDSLTGPASELDSADSGVYSKVLERERMPVVTLTGVTDVTQSDTTKATSSTDLFGSLGGTK